jgi:type IV secretion system protein VirB9
MKHAIAALLACGGLAAPAAASPPGATDPRVVETLFRQDAVVDLVTHSGYQTTIAFADGEHVENIAIGSSGVWQVTPNRRADRVFVKPGSPAAQPTNMTVITDRRTYLFSLRAGSRGRPLFLLRFTYPPEPDPAPPTGTGPARTGLARTGLAEAAPAGDSGSAALKDAAAPRFDPATLNFGWLASGARPLLPQRVFDDGQSVYLSWEPDRPLPAILTPGPDGKQEGMVNYTSADGAIVVDGTPARLILRSGKAVAYLDRKASAPAPAPAPAPAVAVAPADASLAKGR